MYGDNEEDAYYRPIDEAPVISVVQRENHPLSLPNAVATPVPQSNHNYVQNNQPSAPPMMYYDSNVSSSAYVSPINPYVNVHDAANYGFPPINNSNSSPNFPQQYFDNRLAIKSYNMNMVNTGDNNPQHILTSENLTMPIPLEPPRLTSVPRYTHPFVVVQGTEVRPQYQKSFRHQPSIYLKDASNDRCNDDKIEHPALIYKKNKNMSHKDEKSDGYQDNGCAEFLLSVCWCCSLISILPLCCLFNDENRFG